MRPRQASRSIPAMALNFEQIICLKRGGPAVTAENESTGQASTHDVL
jgi:hypothetical protein